MKIGELARLTGVSVRSLRHYEEEGLIRPARAANGYRHFGPEAVEEVLRIREMVDSGLSARIVRDILPYLDGPSDVMPLLPCEYMLDEVARRRAQLDRRIALLSRSRDAIDAYLSAARAAAGA